ncbi:hypothetical protein OROHE_001098 [Orobanche hederae]
MVRKHSKLIGETVLGDDEDETLDDVEMDSLFWHDIINMFFVQSREARGREDDDLIFFVRKVSLQLQRPGDDAEGKSPYFVRRWAPKDHVVLFDEWVAQLPKLLSEQYLGMSLGSLNASIRDHIPNSEVRDPLLGLPGELGESIYHQQLSPAPCSSRDLYSVPIIFSLYFSGYRSQLSTDGNGFSQHLHTSQNTSIVGQPKNTSAGSSPPWPNRNIRHLTAEEAREYRAKEKCYKCSQLYGPLQKYPLKFLTVMLACNDEDEDEDVKSLQPCGQGC